MNPALAGAFAPVRCAFNDPPGSLLFLALNRSRGACFPSDAQTTTGSNIFKHRLRGRLKGCSMSLLRTLKGQILVVSAACMVAALLALTLVNYFSARAQARVALAEEGRATAKSHAEAIEEWTRAKAASSRPPSRPLKSLSPPNPWPCCVMRASSAPRTLATQTKSTFSPKPATSPPTTTPLHAPGTSRLPRLARPWSRRPTSQPPTRNWW